MNVKFWRLVLPALLLTAGAFFTPSPADAQMKDGKELVKASLLTDVDTIQPGQKFRIGVLYRIEPGWHIYWKYSGDSGIPTKIDWQLPAGFKVGDLQWPLPVRDKEPGDLQVFVYNMEVLLFAEVEAPKELPAGPIELRAKSDWLVCQSLCVPGSAELSTTLNAAGGAASASPAIFDKYANELPKPLPPGKKVTFTRAGKALHVIVAGAPAGAVLDFFPVPPGDSVLGHAMQSANTIIFPIDTEPKPIDRLEGVLVVGSGADRQGFTIDSAVAATSIAPPAEAKESSGVTGLLPALLLAILGGLILNVMPCVLPVIALKIFGFVSEAGEKPDKIFRLSLAFSAGILSCFALLAACVILLRSTGAEIGWGFQFQDYRFILVISCLVFAFALNLFGVYEIAVSARATGGLAKLAGGRGYSGAFFQGVFATVLATPCTAPFLGTASAFAFAQPAGTMFLVFLFIGLGMALPYLVLALNPGWIRYLPKPGAWMLRLKQFMGFLLLGTLLWLIWILGQLKGVDGIVSLGAVLLVIAVLAWIKGAYWTPISSPAAKRLGAAAMLLVVLVALGGYSFITKPSKLLWQEFTQESLSKALASGRPVFVDFTADWCITCKTNERFAIDTASVRDAFARMDVVTLRADWTHGDPMITEILKKHGRAGVPMYLFYPGGKDHEPVVLPELISSQTVLDALKQTGTMTRNVTADLPKRGDEL
jgi:thiol:disulfide interchange protein DsbD